MSTTTGIVEAVRTVVASEISKIHFMELGIVTSVFPHSSENDKDNYECNIKLRDKDVELRKVPVATQHIGLVNVVHVNDLVLVSFINGDINSPVVLGRLYNDEDRPPMNKMEEIVYKPPYVKNTQLKRLNIVLPEEVFNLQFFDDRIVIQLGESHMRADSKGNISIRSVSNQQSTCEVNIGNGNVSIAADGSISVSSGGSLSLSSGASLSIQAKEGISLNSKNVTIDASDSVGTTTKKVVVSGTDGVMVGGKTVDVSGAGGMMKISDGSLDIDGKVLNMTAQTNANINGNATANINGGVTNIKGGVVNIN